ncbi:hypothetical protein DYB25_004221 [Aphanomyces astaci]|uniref:Uncharacterized protein n=1 Tax=Aphanomyces astaci TaxID=112090 RepID=A0A397BF42_APHAT|nr:hypothetical protein DYB25_004221 [Aphanomyces astaci]
MWRAKGTKYLLVHLSHPLSKEMAIKKLVKGVFQEHFEFLHWVHDYVHRTYPDAMRLGNAYARREQILQKSGDAAVNLNLIPKFSMRNNASLEAELHGRIKDLVMAESSRKHYFDLLREVEVRGTLSS